MDLCNEIAVLSRKFRNLLEFVDKAYNQMPEGNIARYSKRGKAYYYHTYKENGEYKRIYINNQPDMIRALCKKNYLKVERSMLVNNLRQLKKVEKNIYEISTDNVFELLPERLKVIPEEFFVSEEGGEKGENGNSEIYEISDYKPEGRTKRTSLGFCVRSKSEVIIAELLAECHIRFHYEEVLRINGQIFVPDFTILIADGRRVYWEHCGMPGNQEYMRHHKWKLKQYEEAGIVPWKNLIITYDTEEGDIDTGIILAEIKSKLL